MSFRLTGLSELMESNLQFMTLVTISDLYTINYFHFMTDNITSESRNWLKLIYIILYKQINMANILFLSMISAHG